MVDHGWSFLVRIQVELGANACKSRDNVSSLQPCTWSWGELGGEILRTIVNMKPVLGVSRSHAIYISIYIFASSGMEKLWLMMFLLKTRSCRWLMQIAVGYIHICTHDLLIYLRFFWCHILTCHCIRIPICLVHTNVCIYVYTPYVYIYI